MLIYFNMYFFAIFRILPKYFKIKNILKCINFFLENNYLKNKYLINFQNSKKGSGLGAHGTERTKQSLVHFPTEEIKKKHEEKEKKKAEKGPQWKSASKSAKKKKIQYKFTTVDELKESGGYGVGICNFDFEKNRTYSKFSS